MKPRLRLQLSRQRGHAVRVAEVLERDAGDQRREESAVAIELVRECFRIELLHDRMRECVASDLVPAPV
jgi:hypothetical protein